MAIKKNLISKKYDHDKIPLEKLNESQLRWLELFSKDPLIKYEQVSNCCLCGDENVILIAKKDRYGIPLDTVVCENCGLIRSFKQLTKESHRLFYEKYFRNIDEGLETHLESINKRYKDEESTYIPKYLSKKDIVVEIGCGGGWKLVPYHRNGYKYYGFDYDTVFINLGRSRGLNLYVGDIEKAYEMGIKADYLILNHILEHVKDPIIFLKESKKVLNTDAIVSIWGPSLTLIPWGYMGGNLLDALLFSHNYLFDEYILEKIALSVGYKIINSLGANIILRNSNFVTNAVFKKNEIQRGRKVVKFLKFAEAILCLKMILKVDTIFLKNIYYLIHPGKSLKKFLIKYIRNKHL